MKLLKLTTIISFFLLLNAVQLSAQATCGATAGSLSGTWSTLMVGDTSATPVFTTNPSGLTHTEFVITNPNVLPADELGPVMLGVDTDGRVLAADYNLGLCDAFCITPFSYNLQELKILVDALLNNDFTIGFPCCTAAATLAPGICDSLVANGISDSSDVTGLTDLSLIISVLSGGEDISFVSFVQTIEILNSSLASFGACAGGLTELCYATDTSAGAASSDCYLLTNTAIPATAVVASPDASMITSVGGTVQYSATLDPVSSTDAVEWSIIGGTAATIDPSTGLATGQGGVDTLWVVATAPNSCVSDTLVLYVNIVSGVSAFPEVSDFDLTVLSNPFQQVLRFQILADNVTTTSTYNYALYDVTGKVLLQKTVANNTQNVEIDTDGLPAGIYRLQVRCGHKQVGKTVVKY